MESTNHTVLWQKVNQSGLEYCHLSEQHGGWQLAGTVLLTVEGCPARIRYQVRCDNLWRTRSVRVNVETGGNRQTLRLTVDGRQRWWLAGRELESVRGCLDVDLDFTPATNTLPVRRLRLAVGRKAKLTAAWLKFPELEITPLSQQYTRLAEYRYRYESGTGFVAELEVDGVGLVTHYPNGWERVA